MKNAARIEPDGDGRPLRKLRFMPSLAPFQAGCASGGNWTIIFFQMTKLFHQERHGRVDLHRVPKIPEL
jgi:hypothetical protein